MNKRRYAMAAAGCAGLLHWMTSFAYAPSEGAASGLADAIKNPAVEWDRLWHEVIVDITVIGIIFALVMAYFLIKYRQPKDGVRKVFAPKLTPAAAVAWVVIPVFVFLADDLFVAANGWVLWNDYRTVPAKHMEVQLESGMYSWDFTYANGVRAQNILRVPEGMPVVMRMTSRDTLHSFFIPDFRVKEDSMPGRVTYLWFLPDKVGEHVITCGAYCGVGHSYMPGKVVVMPAAEFDAWLKQQTVAQAPAAAPNYATAQAKKTSEGEV